MKNSHNPYDTEELVNNCFPLSAYLADYTKSRVMAFVSQILRGNCTTEKAAELMHLKTNEFCEL